MDSIINTKLDVAQTQSLNTEQLASLKILAMNSAEVSGYIHEIMMSNPAVDIDGSGLEEKTISISYRDIYYNGKRKTNYTSMEETDVWQTIGYTDESLQSHLRMQLRHSDFSRQELKRLNHIIACLDDSGYMSEDDYAMCADMQISRNEYERLLAIVQSLDPAGVGARDLRECLLIQLRRLDRPQPIAEKIVEAYLEELANNRISFIAKSCKTKAETVLEVKKLLSQLQYDPGAPFKNNQSPAIVPDLTVNETDQGFDVQVVCPTCVLNPYYKQMLHSVTDEATKVYINNCYKEAKTVQNGIAQRNSTLAEIGKILIEEQMNFFCYGESCLKGMRQKDIAERLQLHESTISRAIKDKYLKCRWGIYPLKYFFSVNLDNQLSSSATNPKAVIKQLVESEAGEAPYSDKQLCQELMTYGFSISVRTVTKYRQLLGYGTAAQRKKFFSP